MAANNSPDHEFRVLWKAGVKGFRYNEFKGRVDTILNLNVGKHPYSCSFKSNRSIASLRCTHVENGTFSETSINCNNGKEYKDAYSNLKVGPVNLKSLDYLLFKLGCTFGKESNAAFLIKNDD